MKVVVPKGVAIDKEPYFCEDNIVLANGTICLKDLPIGEISSILDPSHEYNQQQGKFKGQLIPIYTVNCEDKKWFKCRHVLKMDLKTGAPLVFCTEAWELGCRLTDNYQNYRGNSP